MHTAIFRQFMLGMILALATLPETLAQAPSPEIVPGIFLPDHGNVWILDTSGEKKALLQLKYVQVKVNSHRGANFGRSLAWPVTTKVKQTVEIPGTAAPLRISTTSPVLYIRSILQDPEEAAQTSAPGSKLALMHLQPVKDARVVDTLNFTMITGHSSRDVSAIEFVSEPIPGTNWIKLTLAKPLDAGEYAVTWLTNQADTFSSVVYDFGIGNPAQAKK